MYEEEGWSYCFPLVDVVNIQTKDKETRVIAHINVAKFPFKNILMLLGCFYTQQLSSTPTYL